MTTLWTPERAFDFIQENGLELPADAMCQKNFRWSEFLVNQHEKPSFEIIKNIYTTACKLQKYRDTIFEHRSINITSGWRSAVYNHKIGGRKNSFHMSGLAIDFLVSGLTPQKVQAKLDKVHFGGLEFAPTWTHIDFRGYMARFKAEF